MRRLLATAAAAALATLAISVPAQAADMAYVALNEKGLKQVLIKKSWGPAWLGPVDDYETNVAMTGLKPELCAVDGKVIKGEKSSSHSDMFMNFTQSKEGHLLFLQQVVYQYKDVQTAEFAWQQLLNASNSCPGTITEDLVQDGEKVGTATVKTSVFIEPSMYGQDQLIINTDVQIDEPLPGGVGSRESADQLQIFTYTGAAIVEISAHKDVPKQKNWVFSEPQIATVETLALLAIQRYHLMAYKAL
jgi:hypothetical protein